MNGKAEEKYPIFHAMKAIVKRLCDMEDFGPFVNLPPKSLKIYYQNIAKPISLTAIKKKLREYQSVTDFKRHLDRLG